MSTDRKQWNLISSGVGVVVWLVLLCLPKGPDFPIGILEQFFLLAPFVTVPLVLVIVLTLLRPHTETVSFLYGVARFLQPLGALLLLLSFFFPKGQVAGLLAAVWVMLAALLCACGVLQIDRKRRFEFSRACLIVAHIFILIGSLLLLLSRLGVTPPRFSEAVVFLAALHFHFTGFAVPVLVGATGYRLKSFSGKFHGLFRFVAVGAIVGVPFIAAGNLFSPTVKLFGVAVVVFSLISFAVISVSVASAVRYPVAKALLLISAYSVIVAMSVAAVYGLGEFTGELWISIPQMAEIHGVINALGFTLCGLLAHAYLNLRQPVADGQESALGFSGNS